MSQFYLTQHYNLAYRTGPKCVILAHNLQSFIPTVTPPKQCASSQLTHGLIICALMSTIDYQIIELL